MSERGAYGAGLPPSPATLEPDQHSEFDAPLNWIQNAFQVTKGQVPRLLNIAEIVGMADLFQDGWPRAIPLMTTIVTPAAQSTFFISLLAQRAMNGGVPVAGVTFANSVPAKVIFSRDVDLVTATVRVLGFDADHIGGAAASTVRVRWSLNRAGDPGANPYPRLVNGSVVNASSLDTAGFFGDKANLWIPPGWDWVIEVPTTVGGELFTFHVALEILPQGVKVQS